MATTRSKLCRSFRSSAVWLNGKQIGASITRRLHHHPTVSFTWLTGPVSFSVRVQLYLRRQVLTETRPDVSKPDANSEGERERRRLRRPTLTFTFSSAEEARGQRRSQGLRRKQKRLRSLARVDRSCSSRVFTRRLGDGISQEGEARPGGASLAPSKRFFVPV